MHRSVIRGALIAATFFAQFVFDAGLSAGASASEIKFTAPSNTRLPASSALRSVADYGDYALFELPEDEFRAWRMQGLPRGVQALPEANRLLFDAHPFDTQTGSIRVPAGWSPRVPQGEALQMVQFVGPVQQAWLDQLRATGALPVHYVANYGYLVWAGADARAALDAMAAQRSVLQFSQPYPDFFKLGPAARGRYDKRTSEGESVLPVTIQMVRHADAADTERFLDDLAVRKRVDWSSIMGFQNARYDVRIDDLRAIAARPDVYWIEEVLPRHLMDEVQNQIVAGNFDGGMTGPSGTGYLAWLGGLGFPTSAADYPVVVIVDDGVGNGTAASGDPTLHVDGDGANPSRLQFVTSCHSVSSGESTGGHGHINTSIVGGYDERTGFPFEDPDGFQRGQGINPWASLASTRIFAPGFDLSACGGTDTGTIQHTWQQGARISTNSWGCSGCAGSYDDGSQAYDAGVRDADPAAPLNQELMVLFAAGNSGPGTGTVGTPGNGKNMLTVGASENDRPSDEDGNWTDGCAVGPSGADNAMDVIGFSSRGPSPGGRVKPETIAPGTHIQGTASTSGNYNGGSVCDQFRPGSQSVFAASSGTSHSTPAVAGVTSLAWWWLENAAGILPANAGPLADPSPALLKAYILAHPTYLTGVSANDTLPSNVQGYGMPNMGLLFDDALKVVVNQDVLLDNSGETWDMTVSAADPARPVRVMMVYTDQAGAIGTSPQVNDLNLSVEAGGQTYLGNVFNGQWSVTGGSADTANNYEAVFFDAGAVSALTVTVSAFNIAGDGVPNLGDATDQDFALVCYNCVQEPTFTLASTPTEAAICTPDSAGFDLDIGSVLGFSSPVALTATGQPAGTTASFTTNPVNPPASSTLTISNTGSAAAGDYTVTVEGTSGATSRSVDLGLSVFTAAAGTAALSSPADGATNVPQQVTLEWSAVAQAAAYTVEVADDSGFGNIVFSATTDATSVVTSPLPSNSVLYWRVSTSNQCGGAISSTRSFTTVALPGDCSIGSTVQTHLVEDFESGANGWTTGGTGSTWVLQGAQVNSGVQAWHGDDVPQVSDQLLTSPPIALPTATSAHTFQFWNRQELEDGGSGCFDGGLLEISSDGGSTWDPVPDANMLTDPYDGPMDGGFSNPAAGLDAWCGDPQAWMNSVVDLSAWAGQTVQLRFRLATDSSVAHPGWWIDDIRVQSCATENVFADGFES